MSGSAIHNTEALVVEIKEIHGSRSGEILAYRWVESVESAISGLIGLVVNPGRLEWTTLS